MIDTMREKEPSYTVAELCEAFGVSRSGYYVARNRPEGRRAVQEKHIVKEMREIDSDRHTRCYGSPRMASELSARGVPCSENRAARLMKKHGINATAKAAFRPKTTVSDPSKHKADARRAIFDYLETFYNQRRRHSSLDNISPEDFLKRHFQNQNPILN